MIEFTCDYTEGAHERILKRLIETNMEQTPGYSEDAYCDAARKAIRRACDAPDAAVHFLVGGTQTNTTVIASVLRPYQGVLAAECGHVAVHETGAIEATGHKVLPLPSKDGKITAAQVRKAYQDHIHNDSFEHMVQPKMVYISNPTEYGAIFSKEELTELHKACKECGLYLYLDGARLAYGLCADGNDLTLPDLAALCDVFYIGGTKCGALFGEAVVISNKELQTDFRYSIKQKGGMLAKGRLLGIQFLELFTDDLYMEVGRHADKLAMKMKEGFAKCGYKFYIDGTTNQQFPIIPNTVLEKIRGKYTYCFDHGYDENTSVVRFCTSWATSEAAVDEFLEDLEKWK